MLLSTAAAAAEKFQFFLSFGGGSAARLTPLVVIKKIRSKNLFYEYLCIDICWLFREINIVLMNSILIFFQKHMMILSYSIHLYFVQFFRIIDLQYVLMLNVFVLLHFGHVEFVLLNVQFRMLIFIWSIMLNILFILKYVFF